MVTDLILIADKVDWSAIKNMVCDWLAKTRFHDNQREIQ